MSDLNASFLRLIDDAEKINQINRSLTQIVDSRLRTELLSDLILFKLAGWIAIPLPGSSAPLLLLKSLKETLLETGKPDLYAVALPQFGGLGFTGEISLVNGALEEFISTMSPFKVVLFSGEPVPDWVFISIQADCYILVGSPEFIIHLLKASVEEAFLHFYSFANSFNEANSLSRRYKEYYSFIYNQLRKYNDAEVGAEFLLNLS